MRYATSMHGRLSENAGRKYLTAKAAKAALAVDLFDAPRNRRPRHNRNPIVACGGDRSLMQDAKKAVHAFRRAYRAAWPAFKELGTTIFPAGSLKMRTRFHMPCAEACFDWCLLVPGQSLSPLQMSMLSGFTSRGSAQLRLSQGLMCKVPTVAGEVG